MTAEEWDRKYLEEKHGPVPTRCPKCGGDRVVRLFWGQDSAWGPYKSTITCGQGLLVAIKQPPAGRPWGCLSCEPEWAMVHDLTKRYYDLQLQKEKSVGDADFSSAIKYRNRQDALSKQQLEIVNRLMSSDPPSENLGYSIRSGFIRKNNKIFTTRCNKFGHPEFVLEADESSVPDIYLTEVADTIERMVEHGQCFLPGQSFQVGWMVTQVQTYDASHLTLVEPDMETFPIKWVFGITHTLRHKMLQVTMLDSVSLRAQIQMPSVVQSLRACTRYSSPSFFMARFSPTQERDSGWFIGCLNEDHNHRDPAQLRCISLYEAYLNLSVAL